jgi:hypothetical protein
VSMTVAALLVAFGAATAFAVSSALEQSVAKREKLARPLDPRLLVQLLHEPVWLAAWIPEAVGTGLQALALNLGPLALVEPMLVSGVFLAIPLEAALNRRRVHARDFTVVAIGAVGLAAFLVAADPRPGVTQPSLSDWLGVALWTGPVLAACLAAGWCTRGALRGVMLGIATGLLYGVGASLLKTLTAQLASNPLAAFTKWELYALVVVGFAAVLLNQNAFQSGRLAEPLTAITMFDPLVSVMIGVTAFHETLSTEGPRLAIQLAAVLAMATGIWLASTARVNDRNRVTAH